MSLNSGPTAWRVVLEAAGLSVPEDSNTSLRRPSTAWGQGLDVHSQRAGGIGLPCELLPQQSSGGAGAGIGRDALAAHPQAGGGEATGPSRLFQPRAPRVQLARMGPGAS